MGTGKHPLPEIFDCAGSLRKGEGTGEEGREERGKGRKRRQGRKGIERCRGRKRGNAENIQFGTNYSSPAPFSNTMLLQMFVNNKC
jgi:hypothetical protein